MIKSTWRGIPVDVVGRAGEYVNVVFKQSCFHFSKGQRVTITNTGLRMSVVVRRPIVLVRTSCRLC